ncbi:MAG: hypothetical protein HZC22_07555 [Rhodocyclales bacterium]|nr:hypothetical protein [Rhodocyclales bacterium]
MRTMMLWGVLAAALVSGCATNLEGVRRFASDTDALVGGVNTQLAYLPVSCEHRSSLVELIHGSDAEISRQTRSVCDDLAVSARAAASMTLGVDAYAKALGALAQDGLATYTSELDGLATSLKGLHKGDSTPVVSADQAEALGKLTRLVLEAATKGMRQRELKTMLAEHESLAVILNQLAAMMELDYVVALQLEQREYATKLVTLKRVYGDKEPIRVRELERIFTASGRQIDARIAAARASAQALHDLVAAHARLRENADRLERVDQIKEVNRYRKQMVDVREALARAF